MLVLEKQGVLIERYLQILLNNKSDEKQYDQRKIVAITFHRAGGKGNAQSYN